MSDESVAIGLAELRGEVRGLRESLDTRLHALEGDLAAETGRGNEEHRRLGESVDAAWHQIRALQTWRTGLTQRAVGIAIGIAIGSGTVSGTAVALIARTVGG